MTAAARPAVSPGATQAARLADGSRIVVRPLARADRRAVVAVYGQASDDEIYLRFMSLGRRTVDRHVSRLFSDNPDTEGFVATLDDVVVGVAELEWLDAERAEVAFLVAHDGHHRGIGTILLDRCTARARERGATCLVASVLATNYAMLEVFLTSGLSVTTRRSGTVVEVVADLTVPSKEHPWMQGDTGEAG